MSQSMSKQLAGLVVWLVITFIAAAIGAAASINASLFYEQLARPEWAPPTWVFGPVWAFLYFLMAIAAWLTWRTASFKETWWAFSLFIIQLALNALWSWLFFRFHFGALAFYELQLLWIMIAATTLAFWRIQWFAGLLLVPYLLWVSYAGLLNYLVWQLNPQLLGS